MCTALVKEGLMGRTLDYERSFGDEAVILPSGYTFRFIHEGEIKSKYRIVGTCHVENGTPLFYDGINEEGVGVCALNFPQYAHYGKAAVGRLNLASFEVISYILANAKSLEEALKMLEKLTVTDDVFSTGLPPTSLHWLVCDRAGSAVIEPLLSGVKICKNPVGVLTNAPPLDYHLTRLSEYTALHPGAPENRLLNEETRPYSRGMGAVGLPGDFSSVSRFVKAAFVKENTRVGGEGGVESLFHIMDSVAVPSGCALSESGMAVKTIYTAIADLKNGVYYYTTYNSREIKRLNLKDFRGSEMQRFDFFGKSSKAL